MKTLWLLLGAVLLLALGLSSIWVYCYFVLRYPGSITDLWYAPALFFTCFAWFIACMVGVSCCVEKIINAD